jgi:predicted permease
MQRLGNRLGIEAAGAVNDLPLRGGGGISLTLHVDGTPPARSIEDMQWARQLIANAGYFRAMGIELLRGRLFSPADNDSLAPRVAIISASMARKYWKDADPVGRTFRFSANDSVPVTVIGMVADVRESTLDAEPGPQMYFHIDARPTDNIALVARSQLPAAPLLTQLREAVRSVAPAQAVYNVRMMDEVMSRSLAPRRTNTMLVAIFAGLALLLAALGVYAVLAYGATQRAREFGIRSALGATGRDIVALVSGELVVMTLGGVVVGLAGAWTLSRVLATLLYGVDVHDPVTFASVPLVLLIPVAIATLVPALRAARVNPTEVMRAD